MKLTLELANLRKPAELTQAEIRDYLEKLYGDDKYHEKHESYKNENITHQESETDGVAYQELAQSHKDRAEQLISTLIQLSGHKEFSELLRHFNNVTPGETRKTACNILETLEVLTYKFANNLIDDIHYFNSKVYTSTFDQCAAGALTSVHTLLEATGSSPLYSAKLDWFKYLTLEFAQNNIEYEHGAEVHIVNTLFLFIKDQYNLTVADDMYVDQVIQQLNIFPDGFHTFVYNNFYSRKGAYALISYLFNIHIHDLKEYIDNESEHNPDSQNSRTISNIAERYDIEILNILDSEEHKEGSEWKTKFKQNQECEEILTIAITQKLVNDKIIDSNALIFTDPSDEAKKHIVVQTPIGWYGANYYYDREKKKYKINSKKPVKQLIDARDLYGLTSNRFTTSIEDYIARKLHTKQNLTFEEAFKSISSYCPIQNPSIADRLFFISDFGNMLAIAFSNTEELSSLTSEDISLWKDILISKNNYDHLKICGEERFNKLIKTELMDHDSAFKLMETTEKSLLHIAVLIENPILVKLLLGNSYGAALVDPKIQDSDGNTALHLALSCENQNIIAIFLDAIKENKIDTTIKNNDSKDAIRMAIDARNIEAIQHIIHNRYDVNTLDADENNIFQYAIKQGATQVISLLIERTDINISNKNKYLQTALHLVASKEGVEDLIQLLYEKGLSLTDHDENGYTPLQEAVDNENLGAVKLLLSLNKEALTIYAIDGLNPVMRAAYNDSKDILAFFLEEKRKQNISIDMVELLDCAIKEDSEVDTIELIFNDMDYTDINDELLYKSCKHKNADKLISLFCEKGLNYNITDNQKNNPLHITAFYNLNAFELLLSLSDIDPNAQNRDGNTPFHIIALSGTFPLSNIDLDVENIDDTTPLDTMEPSETLTNTELDAENRYDNAPFDDTMEHSETSSNTDTYDENIDNNPPFDITKLPEIEFKSIIIDLLDIFDHNIKNNEGLTPIDILKQRNAYNASLDEIIRSYESRKRPILSTIEMPMVPEEGKSKRQRPSEESTCVLNDLNTSTVINNINEVMNGINNTIPNQTNNPPDLGRGL